jgi:hypothetical protein
MDVGQLDLAYLALRTFTALVLLVAALLSVRLMFFYKGGMMERTWFSLLVGIVFFALAQPIAAVAGLFESDLLRVVASMAALLGGLLVCWGLYRTLRAWRKVAENP